MTPWFHVSNLLINVCWLKTVYSALLKCILPTAHSHFRRKESSRNDGALQEYLFAPCLQEVSPENPPPSEAERPIDHSKFSYLIGFLTDLLREFSRGKKRGK
jgi:hypothetical protein